MPSLASPTRIRFRQALIVALLLSLAVLGFMHKPIALFDDSCLVGSDGLVICAASDMARVTRTGSNRLTHPRFDLRANNEQTLHWRVARNETIAFQLILRKANRQTASSVAVSLQDSPISTSLFSAHYHEVKNAGYTWGPRTTVLPYPASYPDALVPELQTCNGKSTRLFDRVAIPNPERNQSLWVDMYVPDNLKPGIYEQKITLTLDSKNGIENHQGSTSLTMVLEVIDAQLPHRPSIDAVGEVYRAYQLEGAGVDRSDPAWQSMAHCYQRLAHQHGMVFIERTPSTPSTPSDWADYLKAFGPALSGKLFSAESGYVGIGTDTPVGVWRTPWPQNYDITVTESLSADQLREYRELAQQWAERVQSQEWDRTNFFAYVFDEVDGPSAYSEKDPDRREYVTRVHHDMQQVQAALDQGSQAALSNAADKSNRVDIPLLWTSHSDPVIWEDDTDTTLVGRVRLWSPNAHAANTEFLAQRIAKGERAWFYHSGHPAVGGHAINLPGTDMRSWGVIGARYGIQGQLMWAVNLGNDALPFAQPSYKPDDDRFGNGVMVYPGKQLDRIGFPEAPGPIPSMRLKAWHRGLQDAELYYLALARYPEEAKALIKALVPRALGESVAQEDPRPTWPSDEATWIRWRDDLITLLQRPLGQVDGAPATKEISK
jgi:hypothetical protein